MSVIGLPASLALFDIGPMEFMIVVAAAIMLFGGDLPDVARKAGRTVRKLRTLASETARNLQDPAGIGSLPGLAEFKQGLDMKDDLDLAKDADIDWHDVARLPAPGEASSTAPTAPAAPPAQATQATQPVHPAHPAHPAQSTQSTQAVQSAQSAQPTQREDDAGRS